jgi:hypothetical protein
VKPTLDYLQERLLLDDATLSKTVKRFPSALGLSISDNLEPKLDWLQKRLNLDEAQLGKLILKAPSILNLSIPDNLEPKLNWLQGRLSLDGDELAKLIAAQPPLLGLSIPTNLEPTLDFYQECIGIEGTKELLARHPVLFMASLERRLKPRLEQLKGAELEVDAGSLQRMTKYTEAQWQASLVYQTKKLGKTLKQPQYRRSSDESESNYLIEPHSQILNYGSSDTLDPALAFYESYVGIEEAQNLATKSPIVLAANVEKVLKPRMEQFERSGLVLHAGWLKQMAVCSEERWGIMIANQEKMIKPTLSWLRDTLVLEEASVNELIDLFPRVLVLNISDDLEPTFKFFRECIGVDEARRFVANHPQVMGASSENQLQPRLEQVKRVRPRMVVDAGWLKSMALYDKERWETNFEVQEEAYWRRTWRNTNRGARML